MKLDMTDKSLLILQMNVDEADSLINELHRCIKIAKSEKTVAITFPRALSIAGSDNAPVLSIGVEQ